MCLSREEKSVQEAGLEAPLSGHLQSKMPSDQDFVGADGLEPPTPAL